MKMVGQHDNRIDHKRMPVVYMAKCGAQHFDVFDQQREPAVVQIDGEKICPSGDKGAAIIRHAL